MTRDEDRFWEEAGEALRPVRSHLYWRSRREKIIARVSAPPVRRSFVLSTAAALAAMALAFHLTRTPAPPSSEKIAADRIASTGAWDARITSSAGEAVLFTDENGEALEAAAGTPLEAGDRLETGPDGRVEVALSPESVIELGPRSRFTVESLQRQGTELKLDVGWVVAKLRWQAQKGYRMRVRTPVAVAAVRGTEFGVEVGEDEETSVAVFDEGKVAVKDLKSKKKDSEVLIRRREEVRVPGVPEARPKAPRPPLKIKKIERLKRHEERVALIRDRHRELSRSWKERPPAERKTLRRNIRHWQKDRFRREPERGGVLRRGKSDPAGTRRYPAGRREWRTPARRPRQDMRYNKNRDEWIRQNNPGRSRYDKVREEHIQKNEPRKSRYLKTREEHIQKTDPSKSRYKKVRDQNRQEQSAGPGQQHRNMPQFQPERGSKFEEIKRMQERRNQETRERDRRKRQQRGRGQNRGGRRSQ